MVKKIRKQSLSNAAPKPNQVAQMLDEMSQSQAGGMGAQGAAPGMAKGGSIDGVAVRGKTKGKIC